MPVGPDPPYRVVRPELHTRPNGELAVATATNEADEIRRRMAQIRRELHEDVREVVAGAEAVTDWHRYIRMYPWASVGVAFAVGYLIVPKRRRSVPRDIATQADVSRIREAVEEVKPRVVREEKPRKSLLMAAFGLVSPLAWRVAQNYALNFAEQWLAQQQQQYMTAATPPPSPSPSGQRRSPGGPGWPGGPPGPGGY